MTAPPRRRIVRVGPGAPADMQHASPQSGGMPAGPFIGISVLGLIVVLAGDLRARVSRNR